MISRFVWQSVCCLVLVSSSFVSNGWADDYHVAANGSDSSDGSSEHPWKSIQQAVNKASAGDTVYVQGGTYREAIKFGKSGNAEDGPITLSRFGKERVVLDGAGFKDVSPMIEINNQSFLTIEGLEICNLKTSKLKETPIGILISGECRKISIVGCKVHNIANTAKPDKKLLGCDAHGIAVYGDGKSPISGLKILGNELYELTLGSSEALVVNGNIDGFEICDNVVRDCDNIGIDCIGFEGVSAKGQIDQARNGIVAGNHVFNIATAANPAYEEDSVAAGIYVDGGRDIIIERNRIHNCDFGIEVASEKKGKVTSAILVRSNVLFNNLRAGLIIGGYDDKSTGDAQNCTIVNNTFFNNDTDPSGDEWGQIHLQYRVSNCSFTNNILQHEISKDGSNLFVVQWNKTGKNNVFNYNQFYGPADPVWVLDDKWIDDWADYQKHPMSGDQEAFGDPMMTSPKTEKWSLEKGSPCTDTGDSKVKNVGEKDFVGNQRVIGSAIDRGAIESNPAKNQ